MANTTADKLAKLSSTKAALKSAINGSGSTVGDVFSTYPTAITSGKSAIAQAITDKGVTTAANATFQQMANNIGQIQGGGGIYITEDFEEIAALSHDDLQGLENILIQLYKNGKLLMTTGFGYLDSSANVGAAADGGFVGTLYSDIGEYSNMVWVNYIATDDSIGRICYLWCSQGNIERKTLGSGISVRFVLIPKAA